MRRIYIASSWKNEAAVVMLSALLRAAGFEVWSFVENNHGEQAGHTALDDNGKPLPFDDWVWSDRGEKSFTFDVVDGAMRCDAVVYIGPSGTDAWAEIGAAYASGKPIFGMWVKSEQAGLMRRMVQWVEGGPFALVKAVAEHCKMLDGARPWVAQASPAAEV